MQIDNQQITVYLEAGKAQISGVSLTLPNGEVHYTADIRTSMVGTDNLCICTSKTTLVQAGNTNEQMVKDMPKICDVLVVTVDEVEWEHHAHLISYFECKHPIFKALTK